MLEMPFGYAEICKFYGWEDRYLKDLSQWEAQMVVVPAPPGFHFYYDKNADGDQDTGEASKGPRVHAKIADELRVCLQLIADAGLWHFVSSQAGGYTFRTQRGSTKLSMHAFGAAVDFDPVRNPFKRPSELTALGTEPGLEVVRIFESRGWVWGGRWSRPDGMHLQAGGGF